MATLEGFDDEALEFVSARHDVCGLGLRILATSLWPLPIHLPTVSQRPNMMSVVAILATLALALNSASAKIIVYALCCGDSSAGVNEGSPAAFKPNFNGPKPEVA